MLLSSLSIMREHSQTNALLHQRRYDKISAALMTLIIVVGQNAENWLDYITFWENIQRACGRIIPLLLFVFLSVSSDRQYLKWRTIWMLCTKVFICALPYVNSPHAFTAYLNVTLEETGDSWLAFFLRLFIGSTMFAAFCMPIFCPAGFTAHLATQLLLLQNFKSATLVCTSPFMSDISSQLKIQKVLNLLSLFSLSGIPVVELADTATPIAVCETILNYSYYVFGLVLPTMILLITAPPAVVGSVYEDRLFDRKIVMVLAWFCSPNRKLLVNQEMIDESTFASMMWVRKVALWLAFLAALWSFSILTTRQTIGM